VSHGTGSVTLCLETSQPLLVDRVPKKMRKRGFCREMMERHLVEKRGESWLGSTKCTLACMLLVGS
jgi:hypothetical protein